MLAGLFDLQARRDPTARQRCAADIALNPEPGAHVSGAAPPVAQMQRHGIVRVSGQRPHGPLLFHAAQICRLTTSPFVSPRRQAVAGLSIAALSQVICVSGLGNSCSQPLFAPAAVADRGIGTENNFNRSALGCGRSGRLHLLKSRVEPQRNRAGKAVPAITPSCSVFSQKILELLSGPSDRCAFQYSRTIRGRISRCRP